MGRACRSAHGFILVVPKQLRQFFRWAACLGVALTLASAEEGKWTPQQLLQFAPQWLKQQGLDLPVSRLWAPARGPGLLAATISTGGWSAGFVTATGLFLPNH